MGVGGWGAIKRPVRATNQQPLNFKTPHRIKKKLYCIWSGADNGPYGPISCKDKMRVDNPAQCVLVCVIAGPALPDKYRTKSSCNN